MAASLDGFITRKDGRVDWLETLDEFAAGDRIRRGEMTCSVRLWQRAHGCFWWSSGM